MADNFAVHLGGGIYLDARGNLVYGPQTGLQVYEAPGGFRLDTKKIQETFKDLSDLLPRDEAARKKWIEWGVPKEIVGSLSKLAGVAGVVATAISVYAWALGVLITVMELMSGDDGMSPQMAQALYSIKNQLHGMEEIQRAEQMISIHSEWDGRVNTMNGLLTRLVVEQPVGATRAQIFEQMRALVDELDVPLSNLRNQEWDVTFDPDGHKARGFAAQLLVFEKSDGTLPSVPMAPATVTTFDYRLGVPMLLYGATTYTALLQVAMPWFRSAGMYAEHLRKTADAIDRFVIRMQDECLARTQYDAQTVFQQQAWKVHDIVEPIGGPRSTSYPPALDYAVGAFDLARYDDAFIVGRYVAQLQAGEAPKKRGLFDYGWMTTETGFDEIAAAANEQARQDYANLQAASGMLRLITTAAWLRFLTTPPERSQTVSGFAQDTRRFLDEAPTTATSPSIFPVGVISHSATRRRYHARGRARVTTQGPGYVPQFHYRIVLRTIDSDFGNGGWDSHGYVGYVWEADHEPTAGDPRCKRLRTVIRQGAVLSERVLYEGTAPSQTVTRSGSESFRATTFDWYVPVLTPWSKLRPASSVAVARAGAAHDGSASADSRIGSGGVSIHLLDNEDVPMHTLSAPGPLAFTSVSDLWFENAVEVLSDVSLEKAERRHAKIEEDVKLDWQLTWTEDKLDVSVSGDPTDRPFQVHVVVEETVYSGEIPPPNLTDVLSDDQLREHIHTPFAIEVVNQLVLVPEEFFAEERKAIEAGSKLYRDFIRRFSEVARVGPGDPVESLEAAIRDRLTRSPSTATLADALDRRAEFARDQASDVWQAVLREGDVPESAFGAARETT
jgi:hypothetical protein